MTDKPTALRLADRLESDLIRSQTMLDAAAELRRLHAENETLRTDAERYRKWRAEYTDIDASKPSALLEALADCWTPDEVDAAIDAAMGEKS